MTAILSEAPSSVELAEEDSPVIPKLSFYVDGPRMENKCTCRCVRCGAGHHCGNYETGCWYGW